MPIFTTAKIWKQPECPLMNEWTKKKNLKKSHTHWNTIQPFKKKEGNAATCNNMGGPGSEISKTDKDKC